MQQLARFPDYSYNMRRRNLAQKKYETREVVVAMNDDSMRNVEEDFSYFHNFSCDSPPPPPATSKDAAYHNNEKGKHRGRILSFNESFTYQPTTPSKKSVEKLINFLTTHRETFLNYGKFYSSIGVYSSNNSVCRYTTESLSQSPTKELILTNIIANINEIKRSDDNDRSESSPSNDDLNSKSSVSPTALSEASSSASTTTSKRDHPYTKAYVAILKKFEQQTEDALINSTNNELRKILKDHGWTGSRYRNKVTSDAAAFEFELLLQDLSNLYLRSKNNGIFSPLNIFVERNQHGGEKDLSQIVSFCPDILVEYIRTSMKTGAGFNLLNGKRPTSKGNNGDLSKVKSFSFFGACMLVDISGFSKFSAAMCSNGVSGLDDLREVTNGFLGHFVKIVYQYDGDVISFAGDAIICVFLDRGKVSEPVETTMTIGKSKSRDQAQSSDHLEPRMNSDGCYRALRCACVLRQHESKSLSTHIALSYGEMKLALLGGINDQWVYVMNGKCVSELSSCIEDAGPQEIAVTPDCYRQAVRACWHGSSIVTKASRSSSSNILVVSVEGLRKPQPSSIGRIGLIEGISNFDHLFSNSNDLLKVVAQFVPKPILDGVSIKSLDHIGELRQITTMFLSLDSYSAVGNQDPSTLQPFFLIAQEVLHESGGFLRQFLVDDKGCVLIAMWGIPSFTYSNNCSRALYCAVSISVRAKEIGHVCSVGVTTGNVFCGIVGAVERRDYAGIGSDVNMAARLMSKAHGRTLIDESTYYNLSYDTKNLLGFAEEMHLKGKDKPIIPFAYISDSIPRISAVDEVAGYGTILRRKIKAALGEQLDKISYIVPNQGGSGSPILGSELSNTIAEEQQVHFTVVTGLPGTGKSTAAQYFSHLAKKRGITCIFLQARPDIQRSPYGIMKALFLELVGLDNLNYTTQMKSLLKDLIEKVYPDLDGTKKQAIRASLEGMLGCQSSRSKGSLSKSNVQELKRDETSPARRALSMEFSDPGNKRSSTSSQHLRAGELVFHKVICYLLHNISLVIIVENAHFCDELSWNELYRLLNENGLLLSILVTVGSTGGAESKLWLRSKQSDTQPKIRSRQLSQQLPILPTPMKSARNGSFLGTIELMESNSLDTETGAEEVKSAGEYSARKPFTAARFGLNIQPPDAYKSICSHPNCTVVEMSGLNEEEVRSVLIHELNTEFVSDDLVRIVLDISSGNAFWCKSIAHFIKERGMSDLETFLKEGKLQALILLRIEQLSTEQQLVLKYASVIGSEFSETMLAAILPLHLVQNVSQSLESLVEHSFIYLIEELSGISVFAFQNQLILSTLYDLMPPRDAAKVHLDIAEHIERKYFNNLAPFYASLGYHYNKCSVDKRRLAFMYEVKAAEEAIRVGSFGDGLAFLDYALSLTECEEDCETLLGIVNSDLLDFLASTDFPNTLSGSASGSGDGAVSQGQPQSQPQPTNVSLPRFTFFDSKNNSVRVEYAKLKLRAERKQKEIRRNSLFPEDQSSKQNQLCRLFWWRRKRGKEKDMRMGTSQCGSISCSSSLDGRMYPYIALPMKAEDTCCVLS